MGKNDRCAVWVCDNDHKYSNCSVIKPRISKWNQTSEILFFSRNNEIKIKTWTKMLNKVLADSGKKNSFQVNKYTNVCSNYLRYGRPVELASHPILFFNGYDEAVTKRKEGNL